MALYAALKTVHLLAIIVWLGGMFFAHFCLRPVALTMPPATRLPLLRGVLGRFFAVISVAAPLTVLSGGWLMGRVAASVHKTGAPFNMPLEWWVMGGLGLLMLLIFGHIRFALYKRLVRAVDAQDWPAGGVAMTAIRSWVFVNLVIGGVIVVVVLMGQG
jgi:uncharacterized membrane protein